MIHAETDSNGGDIRSYLNALQSYCEETYSLPADVKGENSRQPFADKWKHRNDFDKNCCSGKGVSSILPVGKNFKLPMKIF